jgi:hypothetical protein
MCWGLRIARRRNDANLAEDAAAGNGVVSEAMKARSAAEPEAPQPPSPPVPTEPAWPSQ